VKLAKAAPETKYWPIIRGDMHDLPEQSQSDPASILSSAPAGSIREILQPRFNERRESLREISAEFADAADMDRLAQLADAFGINSFGGRGQIQEEWLTEPSGSGRVSFHTLREQKGKPAAVVLVRVEHSCEVSAYLGFGGWNDCPSPELQVAVLREWRKEYQAVPACITSDVLECVVVNRPQTEPEAMKLAAEQWIFCDDIVGQGTQSIRNLAMEIWKSPTWFFWWD
jgi:hypothetical protein